MGKGSAVDLIKESRLVRSGGRREFSNTIQSTLVLDGEVGVPPQDVRASACLKTEQECGMAGRRLIAKKRDELEEVGTDLAVDHDQIDDHDAGQDDDYGLREDAQGGSREREQEVSPLREDDRLFDENRQGGRPPRVAIRTPRWIDESRACVFKGARERSRP